MLGEASVAARPPPRPSTVRPQHRDTRTTFAAHSEPSEPRPRASVATQELSRGESSLVAVSKTGWCQKESQWLKVWRARWLVLSGDALRSYSREGGDALGDAPTETFSVRGLGAVLCGYAPAVLLLGAAERPVSLEFATEAERDAWASAIVNARQRVRTGLAAYASASPSHHFEPPNSVRFEERYRLGALLGTGATSTVHAGTCLQCGRAVAVKRLDTRRASARDRARLREEIDVLLAVRGAPSVCQLWDAFETPNVSLLVLELLPGGDLFEQVVRRFGGGSPSVAEDAYTEDEVRELLRTALRGLAALHEMSIVHRDIKPENLVLSEAGEVVVTDFGLAKRLATGELCSEVVGTAGYMSPEVLRREAYSYAADVWSLGVVLYVLLSGSPPFPFDDEKIEAELIKAGRWSFAGPNWGDVSDDAKQCVRFMMAPLAQVRWPPKRLLAHPWLAVPADAANGDDKNGETHGDEEARPRARSASSAKRRSLAKSIVSLRESSARSGARDRLRAGVRAVQWINRAAKLSPQASEEDLESEGSELSLDARLGELTAARVETL